MTRRRVFWLPAALLLAFVLLLVGVAGSFVYQKHMQAEKLVADVDARYARLQGLKGSQLQLDQFNEAAVLALAQQTYPTTQDATQAANDAQQRVQALFAGAGLDVVSIQALAAKPEKHFDRIPLVVRLEGQLTHWQSGLVVLMGQKPSVFVDGFSVQTVGFVKADTPQKLAIQLSLYVLRSRP